jgi:hypothetical protein
MSLQKLRSQNPARRRTLFARVLLNAERGRFPLSGTIQSVRGRLLHHAGPAHAGLRGARCTGAGEGPPVCIRWFQEALAQAEPERANSLLGNRGGAPKGERARSHWVARAASEKVRYPAVRLLAPCLPSLVGGTKEWLGAAKLGCRGIAGMRELASLRAERSNPVHRRRSGLLRRSAPRNDDAPPPPARRADGNDVVCLLLSSPIPQGAFPPRLAHNGS